MEQKAAEALMPETQNNSLTSAKLNYVWDWWKFHAKQRVDMFNYFLVITGILANAYAAVIKPPDTRVAAAVGLAVFGVITSAGFILLDVRNRRQLERSNRILRQMESDELKLQPHLADIGGNPILKHRFVFRTVETLVGSGWVLALFFL